MLRDTPDHDVLAGKRIAITRRAEDAAASAKLVAAAGAAPVILPAIALESLDGDDVHDSIARAPEHDWLIFVSTAAVERFAQLWEMAGQGRDALGNLRIAAVGPITTASVRAQLGREAWLPTRYRGYDLAATLPAEAGASALVLGAREGDPALVAGLQARGICVEKVALYATVPAEPPPNLAVELSRGFDVVTFASPSAARAFVGMVGIDAVNRAVVASIGETTADAARALEIRVRVVAREHTFAGLVDAIAAYYSSGKTSE